MRFHTFNKRVMVYDIPRNFIGDTHWRDEEVIRDGAELRLDKGVLVEVGEATGTTEQDLTELLEKARPMQERTMVNANARSKYLATARSSMTPSAQSRPKSLNALFGIPRGAYGRAILPVKFPFENRSTVVDRLQEDGYPTKRQRLDGGVKTVTTTAPAAPAPCKELPPSLQTNILKPTASLTTTLPKPVEHDVISIDSDDDELISSSPAKPAYSSLRGQSEARRRLSTSQRTSPRPMGKGHKLSVPPLRDTLKSAGTSMVHDQQVFGKESLSNPEVRTPVNCLRSAASKSRRKLMYREYLRPRAASKSPHANTGTYITTAVEKITDSHLSSIPSLGNNINAICASSSKNSTNADSSSTETFLAGRPFALREDRQHIGNIHEKGPLFVGQSFSHEMDADMEFTRRDLTSHVQYKPITIQESGDPIAAQLLQCTPRYSTLGNDCIPYCNTELRNPHQIQTPVPQLEKMPLTRNTLNMSVRPVRLGAVLVQPQILDLSQCPGPLPLSKALPGSNGSERLANMLPTKLFLQSASSDLSRICRPSPVMERIVKEDVSNQDNDLGPWNREAFDIFGWKPGYRKDLVSPIS